MVLPVLSQLHATLQLYSDLPLSFDAREMNIKFAVAMLAALAALASGEAIAQQYPARPMRFLVGSPPGSGNDLVSRLLGRSSPSASASRSSSRTGPAAPAARERRAREIATRRPHAGAAFRRASGHRGSQPGAALRPGARLRHGGNGGRLSAGDFGRAEFEDPLVRGPHRARGPSREN